MQEMRKCFFCGEEIEYLYKCRNCGEFYCSEHRLPENHYCEGLEKLKKSESKELIKKTEKLFLKPHGWKRKRDYISDIKSYVILFIILSPLLYFFVIPFMNGIICYMNSNLPYICPIKFKVSVEKATMTEYDNSNLQEAMKQWEIATNNRIKFQIVNYGYLGAFAGSYITWDSSVMGGLEETTTGWFWIFPYRFKTITIGRNYMPCQDIITTIHELGHALELSHSNDPQSVMYPWGYCNQIITQKDTADLMKKATIGFIF